MRGHVNLFQASMLRWRAVELWSPRMLEYLMSRWAKNSSAASITSMCLAKNTTLPVSSANVAVPAVLLTVTMPGFGSARPAVPTGFVADGAGCAAGLVMGSTFGTMIASPLANVAAGLS